MSTETIDLDAPSLGARLTGLESDGITHFRGVPYASVARRWTHSRALGSLDTATFDATAFGPRSPVPPRTSVIWSDDPPDGAILPPADELRCLNLNISLPTAALPRKGQGPASSPLPTLVWIHGWVHWGLEPTDGEVDQIY